MVVFPYCVGLSFTRVVVVLQVRLRRRRLPKWYLLKHREQYFTNWKLDERGIVSKVLHQKCGICWAISTVRQFAAMLKIRGYLPAHKELSIQDLVQMVHSLHPRSCPHPTYGIDYLELAGEIMRRYGLVREAKNPLDYQFKIKKVHKPSTMKYYISGMEIVEAEDYSSHEFEKALLNDLKHSPLACSVKMYPSYKQIKGKSLYSPDIANEVAQGSFHMMLCVASGKTKHGQLFLEFQDSFGEKVGHKGFTRLRLGMGLVDDYVRLHPERPFWMNNVSLG